MGGPIFPKHSNRWWVRYYARWYVFLGATFLTVGSAAAVLNAGKLVGII